MIIISIQLHLTGMNFHFILKSFLLLHLIKREVFTILQNPFIIDLTDVICDLSSMQFYIKDTSSLNFPLTCSYESTTFKCELTTESDINLLTTSSYGLYLENSKIQDITLIECTEPTAKINSVKGICLEKWQK